MQKNIFLTLTILLCWGSVAIAYFYFQLFVGLPPCPLCILDRMVLIFIGVCVAGMLFLPGLAKRIAYALALLGLVAGLAVGIRHVLLERLPHDSGSSGGCIPQKQAQGLLEFLTSAFIGTGDCGVVYWTLWGFSLADFTLVLYAVIAFFLLFLFPARPGRSSKGGGIEREK